MYIFEKYTRFYTFSMQIELEISMYIQFIYAEYIVYFYEKLYKSIIIILECERKQRRIGI